MVDALKGLLTDQLLASLSMLGECIDRCPDAGWDAPVANLAFCQAAFHAIFYTDVYLGHDTDSLKKQAFHRDKTSFFRGYEELEDRKQELLYDRADLVVYLAFCRDKVTQVVSAESAESLGVRCGFDWLTLTRCELYVYIIRHVQHHAAQLSLRLRLDHDVDVPWVRAGWHVG